MKKTLFKAVLIGLSALAIATSAQAGKKLKMSTIAPGTSAYLTMTTMATMINQAQDDINIQVDATGAATKHMVGVAKGKIDIAMISPTIYKFMKTQKAMYKKLKQAPELSKKLNLLFWFPYGQYHTVVYADSGIKTLKDIKGKRVFLGPPGGGAWKAAANWIKAATGYEPKKDFENVKGSWSSAVQGFQDRQFDVFINGGVAPFPQVEQLALTSKLHLLGLSKEEFMANPAAKKVTSIPGREVGIIQAGAYGDNIDNKADVYTLASVVGVTVNESMDNDTVYQLVKLFWEGVDKSSDTSLWLKKFNKQYAVQNGGVKLHPGAVKYYKEQGVKIPAGSM